MSALLPNQIAILSELCSDPARLAQSQIGQSREIIVAFLSNAHSFIAQNHSRLICHYVLEFSELHSSNQDLSFSHVLSACAKEQHILRVDSDLRLIHSYSGGVRVLDACRYTSSANALQIVVHGTYISIVLCGQLIEEKDVIAPGKRPPIGSSHDKGAADIPLAIKDHFEVRVRREKGFKYWHDASKRLLVAEPESTERVFQRAIFLWLEEHIVDKLRLYAEPRSLGQDATDVTVVTIAGEHIIEIKWLGKNKNFTEYKQERINEGLRQVAIYLNNDPRAIRGYVLLYDARSREEYELKSSFNAEDRHRLCDEPIILFLENETPSQTAGKKSAPKKKQK